MNSIILCEGRTDAILLSYYLERAHGWHYSKNAPEGYLNIKPKSNQEANWYKKGNSYLMIFAVGGKDNFKEVIDDYVSPILQNYPPQNSFYNIVIIADKDSAEISEIEKLHSDWLKPYVSEVVNSEWQENNYEDAFNNVNMVRTLSIIIPADKQGALETTLLDAISEDEYDKKIVEKCRVFVGDIRSDAKKYIKTDRLALKAHLSTVFVILSPEIVFKMIDGIMRDVSWEKSQTLRDCFKPLEELA